MWNLRIGCSRVQKWKMALSDTVSFRVRQLETEGERGEHENED